MSTTLSTNLHPRPTVAFFWAHLHLPPDSARPWRLPGASGRSLLTMPFDALRFQYASAVAAGLVRPSLLASGRWERALAALERLLLGPLARQR